MIARTPNDSADGPGRTRSTAVQSPANITKKLSEWRRDDVRAPVRCSRQVPIALERSRGHVSRLCADQVSLGISEILDVKDLPIILSGTAHPEAERDCIRCAFVVGNVNGVAARVECDVCFLGKSRMEVIELDDALVVDLQHGSVIR